VLTGLSALDLRVMQEEYLKSLDGIIVEEISSAFAPSFSELQISALFAPAVAAAHASFAQTSTMDAETRLFEVMGAVSKTIVETLSLSALATSVGGAIPLAAISSFRSKAASRGAVLLQELRRAYLTGEHGPAPASSHLRGTRPVYEFIRITLGIRMHGKENLDDFKKGLGVEDVTIGENISTIYEVSLRLAPRDIYQLNSGFRLSGMGVCRMWSWECTNRKQSVYIE
jgi:phenylalanine ammonia-lyase